MYEPLDDEEFQNPDYAQKGRGCHDFYFYRILNILIEIQILGTKPEVHAEFVLIHLNDFLEKVRVNVQN